MTSAGWRCRCSDVNRPGREISYVTALARNHVDGLIFVTNHPDDGELAAVINQAGKFVIVDEDVPNADSAEALRR